MQGRFLEELILNKKVTLTIVLLIPLMSISTAYFMAGQNALNESNNYSINFEWVGRFIGKKETVVQSDAIPSAPQVSVFENALKPIYSNPMALEIASVNIQLKLIEVGVDDTGGLEAPKEWLNGGWYNDGAKAGEPGNLVINGHYDDNLGRPAAFWTLKNVSIGDKVTVKDSLGRFYVYTVTEKFYVDINDPDRLKIFENQTDKAHITLITCGGVWLSGYSTYSKRLVIKGELRELR